MLEMERANRGRKQVKLSLGILAKFLRIVEPSLIFNPDVLAFCEQPFPFGLAAGKLRAKSWI